MARKLRSITGGIAAATLMTSGAQADILQPRDLEIASVSEEYRARMIRWLTWAQSNIANNMAYYANTPNNPVIPAVVNMHNEFKKAAAILQELTPIDQEDKAVDMKPAEQALIQYRIYVMHI